MLRPTATMPFAHVRSSGPTRFGTAAAETDQIGDSRVAVMNAITSSCPGVRANASATKPAAAARSAITSTFRRSNRSPSALPSGANRPWAPNVSSSVHDTQRDSPVSWNMM